MKPFTARLAAAIEVQNFNAFVVALYEHTDGSGEHLEFQRALTFHEQDIRTGMNTYCIVASDGASCYGGVVEYGVTTGNLWIKFNTKAATTLGTCQDFHIDLAVDDSLLSSLRTGLIRIFGFEPQESPGAYEVDTVHFTPNVDVQLVLHRFRPTIQ